MTGLLAVFTFAQTQGVTLLSHRLRTACIVDNVGTRTSDSERNRATVGQHLPALDSVRSNQPIAKASSLLARSW